MPASAGSAFIVCTSCAAAHRLHVPIGDDQAVALLPHPVERRIAVVDLIDVAEADRLRHLAENAAHRLEIIDDQNGERLVHDRLDRASHPT